jgi:hypothetical protein
MKKIIALLFFLSFGYLSLCQYNGNVWVFGDSVSYNFVTNNFEASNCVSRGSCVSICSKSNLLLFYAFTRALGTFYSTLIYDGSHNFVPNGNNIVGQAWYKELIILPIPEDTSKFILFSCGVISPDEGLGDSVISKNNLITKLKICDGITAVKHGNGRDWWVIYRQWSNTQNNEFYVVRVDPSGVSTPIISNIGKVLSPSFCTLKFNNKGNKLLRTHITGLLELYDFDRCTGTISNALTIRNDSLGFPYQDNLRFLWSAFSPNDSVLYVGTAGNTSYLYQFDLFAPNIYSSQVVLDTTSFCVDCGGEIKLAPDGKIYYTHAYHDGVNWNYPYPDTLYNMYNTYLGVINEPDKIGTACNFQPFSFYLGGYRTYWGLPNNPDYELGPLVGSGCDTLSLPSPSTGGALGTLSATFISAWQTLFVNAQHLRGKTAKVRIYSSLGVELLSLGSENTNGGYCTKDIHLPHLAAGVYIVTLTTEDEQLSVKFVVE